MATVHDETSRASAPGSIADMKGSWLSRLPSERREQVRPLLLAAVIVGMGVLGLSYKVLEPALAARTSETPVEQRVFIPAYDYSAFASMPVQSGGRTMPFCTAAEETVRNVTGRARFQGQDPVAVVLQWMLMKGTSDGAPFTDWEKYPFILCDHRDLRKIILQGYRDSTGAFVAGLLEPDEHATNEQLSGKYIAPEQLRRSEAFKRLVEEADDLREEDMEKASQKMTPEQRKAEEVARRLVEFDSVSQNSPSTWGKPSRPRHQASPFHFVALDRVPGGGWFGLDQLRDAVGDETKWQAIMRDRLADSPQLYLAPAMRQDLESFQADVKAGKGSDDIDRLAGIVAARRDERIARYNKLAESEHKPPLTQEHRDGLARLDQEKIDQMKRRLPGPGDKYHPDDLRFRMLHLDYLETLHPDLYPASAAWQSFPKAEAERVLASYDQLAAAYRTNDPVRFAPAAESCIATLGAVSEKAGPYPGGQTVAGRVAGLFTGASPALPALDLLRLEMTFDHVQPFRWAWVLMLLAAILFAVSLAAASRALYWAAFAGYLGSLGFQAFGFFARVVIAGRPPVSNMYETVIWVAFMSAMFGLVLELIYRRRVIGLAAALVSTLGLVLADQLPLALDPRISPIAPVLRSNYWLTIHVLTIVSSYAAGTLAWGLGNVSLALLAFCRFRRETLKMLSQFTYRAIQIAVLLLAAGTFLGGWWAAESWGRFWGWDPKEVWALIALVSYVIPLHMRYIGWVKDFGLAVSAVLCYAAIVMAWYGVNFVLGAGLHSYGFGGGGPWWVFWAGLINVEWVLVASILYLVKSAPTGVPATSGQA